MTAALVADADPSVAESSPAESLPRSGPRLALVPAEPHPAPDARPRPARRRLSGLDGLRALAVAAVVAFHLNPQWLPGGFLGVDVFFVISGFLITRNLVGEFLATDRIRYARFLVARARRLYPAMGALVGVVALAGLGWRDETATLRGSIGAALSYTTNWWLIFDHQSYFVSTGRPPMLQHLWSLAIEEQYYVIWALVVIGLTVLFRRRRGLVVGAVAVTGVALALASTVAMSVIAHRTGVPYRADSSRIYFGTDTHSTALLLGSAAGALAVLLTSRPGRPGGRRRIPVWLTDLTSLVALIALGWELGHLDEYVPGLYQGGFLGIDALALLVVVTISRWGSWAGRLLDIRPVRWAGLRSYSIYLWHWPVVVVTRPGLDVHGPGSLVQPARVVLILALAALSYRFVELPLRSRLGRRRAPTRPAGPPRYRLVMSSIGAGLALAAVTTLLLGATARPAEAAPVPVSSPDPAASGSTTAVPPVQPAALTASDPATRPARRPVPAAPGRAAASPRPAPKAAVADPTVSAYGDSVLLGAQPALDQLDPAVRVDAVEGRQAYSTLDDVAADLAHGRIGAVVVIHTGNNGVIDPQQLRTTLKALSGHRVVLLNDRVPRDWQAPNNAAISAAAAGRPNVTLVNWYAVSGAHPDWLYADGIHLTPAGRTGYANLVLAAVRAAAR